MILAGAGVSPIRSCAFAGGRRARAEADGAGDRRLLSMRQGDRLIAPNRRRWRRSGWTWPTTGAVPGVRLGAGARDGSEVTNERAAAARRDQAVPSLPTSAAPPRSSRGRCRSHRAIGQDAGGGAPVFATCRNRTCHRTSRICGWRRAHCDLHPLAKKRKPNFTVERREGAAPRVRAAARCGRRPPLPGRERATRRGDAGLNGARWSRQTQVEVPPMGAPPRSSSLSTAPTDEQG